MKPILIYWGPYSPNPSKVLILLEELGLPYESKRITTEELTKPEYTAINPNGRLPSIHDPNTDITLWETGAIYLYLIETYDKDFKLSYSTFPEKYLLQQWSYFQASGQGPYYGQTAWYNKFDAEKPEIARKRYGDQLLRVVGVLNSYLKDHTWLVGDKATYADLAFFMWDSMIDYSLADGPVKFNPEEYPHWKKWHDAVAQRPAVQTVLTTKLASEEVSSAGSRE